MVHSLNTSTAQRRARPKSGAQKLSRSPTWAARTPSTRAIICFPGSLSGSSLSGSRGAKVQTRHSMVCGFPKWSFNPLCHSACLPMLPLFSPPFPIFYPCEDCTWVSQVVFSAPGLEAIQKPSLFDLDIQSMFPHEGHPLEK